MEEDSIINLIANNNYIVLNRSLIKELGLKEAVILGELASEYHYYKKNELLDENGYFYSTIENVKENTTLSSYEQKKCLDNLTNQNIVDVVVKGIPATRYIKINSYQLINLFANNLETSFQKIKKLDIKKLRGNNNKNNNKNNKKEIYKEKRFIKPTLEEVKEYCLERNNNVDAEQFIDYYETNGWVQGKGKPIKNWKACIRTWERNRINEHKETRYEREKRLLEEMLKDE